MLRHRKILKKERIPSSIDLSSEKNNNARQVLAQLENLSPSDPHSQPCVPIVSRQRKLKERKPVSPRLRPVFRQKKTQPRDAAHEMARTLLLRSPTFLRLPPLESVALRNKLAPRLRQSSKGRPKKPLVAPGFASAADWIQGSLRYRKGDAASPPPTGRQVRVPAGGRIDRQCWKP